jgi:hypothetical protein
MLIVLSAAIYFVHYLIFRDPHHIFLYLVGDIAFVPVEVLLVTLIIHRVLSSHEKRAMIRKLNMVIGAFFTEAGTDLLEHLCAFARDRDGLRPALCVKPDWPAADFDRARRATRSLSIDAVGNRDRLAPLKALLSAKKEFLLRLLENPNLLEHEDFTDLLWAVTHLLEELEHRDDFANLPDSDCEHLAGDIARACGHLLREWLSYVEHLKESYPYLFSLAVRTNPFDPEACVTVR